jgi:hypothetical protein
MTLNMHTFHTRFLMGDCPVPVSKLMDNLPSLYRDRVNYFEAHLEKYPAGTMLKDCAIGTSDNGWKK